MLDIDTAIKNCLEVAEQNERNAAMSNNFDEWTETEYKDKQNCIQCAADHRQLAEWLTDYKKLREKIKKLEKELEVAKLINHAEFKTLCKYNHVEGSKND